MNHPVSGVEDAYPRYVSVAPAQPRIDVESAAFYYGSGQRKIIARGIAEHIGLPVYADGSQPDTFHKAVNAALGRARSYGQKNPIVIGAIPFDTSRPSSLYVPREVHMLEGDQSTPARPSVHVRTSKARVLKTESVPGEVRFKQSVSQAVANFRLSDIRKAVLSRILNVELDQPADTEAIFERLKSQNPSGYHFRLPLPDGSELIGASPELLLRKQGRDIYSNPLAGSARRQSDPARDKEVSEQLSQSDKDSYEHKLVIDDIKNVLTPFCSELDVPEKPSLINTPAMWHLSTFIRGQVAVPSTSVLEIATHMHPTPAVCGFPTRQARKLINLVEPYERGPFAGMVGWCDSEGNGEWVVTIRCGRIYQNQIQIFAGAGIVEDSCPESEWAETEAKMQTMLNALGLEL